MKSSEEQNPQTTSVRPSGRPSYRAPAHVPSWMAEVAHPTRRRSLWIGIWSGYALAVLFCVLAYIAGETGAVPHHPALYIVLGAKIVTNTIAWLSLKGEFAILETQSLNTFMDFFAITSAIYFTGGPLSPLFSMYIIVIAILALLTNVGVTITATLLALTLHSGATLLAYAEIIPRMPPPFSTDTLQTPGQVAIAILFGAVVLGSTGTFTSLLVLAHRRKADRLEERTRELIEANAQRTMLLANITHELRTPIHGICGLADVLEAGIYGPVTEDQRGAYVGVREAGSTLLAMIDDLLMLAKAEAGAMKLVATNVDLGEFVETVAGSVRWMIGTKELTLDLERAKGTPAIVHTDRGKLSQILVNLLANAVKFTPEKGRVLLRVEPSEGGVAFLISDTGIGIEEDELERIFEPFEQVDASDEREYGGSGLGLAIVRRLAKLIGAKLEVDSEVGAGTTFRVSLPRRATENVE